MPRRHHALAVMGRDEPHKIEWTQMKPPNSTMASVPNALRPRLATPLWMPSPLAPLIPHCPDQQHKNRRWMRMKIGMNLNPSSLNRHHLIVFNDHRRLRRRSTSQLLFVCLQRGSRRHRLRPSCPLARPTTQELLPDEDIQLPSPSHL
jgi:hypothetical protein